MEYTFKSVSCAIKVAVETNCCHYKYACTFQVTLKEDVLQFRRDLNKDKQVFLDVLMKLEEYERIGRREETAAKREAKGKRLAESRRGKREWEVERRDGQRDEDGILQEDNTRGYYEDRRDKRTRIYSFQKEERKMRILENGIDEIYEERSKQNGIAQQMYGQNSGRSRQHSTQSSKHGKELTSVSDSQDKENSSPRYYSGSGSSTSKERRRKSKERNKRHARRRESSASYVQNQDRKRKESYKSKNVSIGANIKNVRCGFKISL